MTDYLGGQGSWLHLTNLGGGRSLGSHNSAASTCAPVDVSRQTTATSCSPVNNTTTKKEKENTNNWSVYDLHIYSSEKRRIFKKNLSLKGEEEKMMEQTSCCLLLCS